MAIASETITSTAPGGSCDPRGRYQHSKQARLTLDERLTGRGRNGCRTPEVQESEQSLQTNEESNDRVCLRAHRLNRLDR